MYLTHNIYTIYAILDIETTGGKYNEEGITEIAIYRFNGHEVVDQFISLINPEREIQPFVVNLTGINSNMLRNAPKFYEVAKRIIEITEDCIIVAHNADFDYRILKTEFNRLGYNYQRKALCTVNLSQQLIPDQASYSLGKLSKSLGIPMIDRHRANGDAWATVQLFKILLNKDSSKTIIKNSILTDKKESIPTNLKHIIEELPSETGVYYIHDKAGTIIYIGKSRNIKKRVNQHFTGTNSKSKKIQLQVASVSYETTGSELIALLKESEAIKHNKPLLNHALKRAVFTHGMYQFIDDNGYINLKISNVNKAEAVSTFANFNSAKSFMLHIVEQYKLCLKFTGLSHSKSSCFNYNIKQCEGACVMEEPPEPYNTRVLEMIKKYSYSHQNMAIIDRGRQHDERSVILIENGIFKGVGYVNLNFQMNNLEILKNIISPMHNNRDTQHIIQSYMRQKKHLKVKMFD